MKKIIIFSVVMILATGCAETMETMIERNLANRTEELTYKNTANTPVEKKAGTLSIGSFVVEDVLPPDTTVVKTSGIVVPLLIINSWRYIYQVNMGYDRIINDYKEFIKESFVEEVKQSSILDYVEKQGDFAVDVTVYKIQIAAPIVKSGAVFITPLGAGGGDKFEFGPLAVDVQANVVLRRNDAVLINKNVGGIYKTDIFDPSQESIGQEGRQESVDSEVLIQDYTSFMIDGLSLAISDLNKNIVTMIDGEAGAIIQKR